MIKKLLIFIGVNLVIATLAGMAPPRWANEFGYRNVAAIHEFVESISPDSPLDIILGDSRPDCCIAAGDMGFVDLSYQGASPVEGFYILKRLVERGVPLNKLIISYGPFHVFTQDAFHGQTRYFGLIDQDYIDTVVDEAESLQDQEYIESHWTALETMEEWVPWLPDPLKFRLVTVLSIDQTIKALAGKLAQIISSGGNAYAAAGSESESELNDLLYNITATDRINDGEASPEFEKPDAVSPVDELYLSRLVDLAKAEKLAVSFVVMPFNRDVLHPNKDYYERYFGVLKRVGLRDDCVGPEYWWPNELFADTHHLNYEGAQRFSKTLEQHIQFCQL